MLEINAHVGEKILTERLGFLDLSRLRARHMQVHRFVRLLAGAMFHEATSTALDLHPAAGFLLDVFDIGAALPHDLCT